MEHRSGSELPSRLGRGRVRAPALRFEPGHACDTPGKCDVTRKRKGVSDNKIGRWAASCCASPDYFAEMADGYREAYVSMRLSPGDVADLVAATAAVSLIRSAFDGVVGTMATSLVVAAIAGGWLRKKT